ncbi:DBH-like monooxygenase protein 1 homolog [Watersipora subatra]|uniref:DBH-like monooxygenase protein 1 homolog n=1 Tax=Watersipora subatra TaxID=2589382 RepID=UPI00355B9297
MYGRAFLLLLAVCSAAGSELSQSAYLDVQEKFHIEWQYTDENVTITATVKTTGWFGIGFSPNGGMGGADIITASVINGKAFLQDRYSEKNGFPTMDISQDVELLSGSEVNGVTTVKFTRKHNTCDDRDMVIGTDTMRVIYAISPDGRDALSYHTPFNRGTRSIYLRKEFIPTQDLPADAFTFDVAVDNIDIPAYHTMYYCELKRIPKLSGKHHIIKVKPLIQEENLGLVHHIILYGCHDSISREKYFEQNNTGFDCYNANMPNDIDVCRAPINIWAVGGGTTFYPKEAGYPLGGDNSPDYFMMEVHYDNPKLISGKKDSSALQVTVTKTLRQYDVGVISTGGIFGLTVPPRADDFTTSVFCPGSCTRKLVKQDLKVFGAFLHGHLAARQVIARQFRNGTEVRTIDEDRHYDFNYQQYRVFKTPIDLKPGDDVMVQCHYNTEDRTKMTYGGLPTSAEMCLTYLYYYPAQDISDCFTMPGWAGFGPDITRRYLNEQLGYPKSSMGNMDTTSLLAKLTSDGFWTKEKIKKLQDDHLTFLHKPICFDNARRYQNIGSTYGAPKAAQKAPAKREFEEDCSKAASKAPNSIVG